MSWYQISKVMGLLQPKSTQEKVYFSHLLFSTYAFPCPSRMVIPEHYTLGGITFIKSINYCFALKGYKVIKAYIGFMPVRVEYLKKALWNIHTLGQSFIPSDLNHDSIEEIILSKHIDKVSIKKLAQLVYIQPNSGYCDFKFFKRYHPMLGLIDKFGVRVKESPLLH